MNTITLNNWFESNFFVITSENVKYMDSHLYGYLFYKNEFVSEYNQIKDINENELKEAAGAYIIINKNDKELRVLRDSMGIMRVYYYVDDSYWAISNSFFKLLQTVAENKKLHFDIGDAESLYMASMMSYSVFGTLVKEIKSMPVWSKMIINFWENKLYLENDYRFKNRISIDSEQGMSIIDSWISKWAGIYKGLEMGGWQMQVELSGGFDSRTVFALLKYAGVDFNKPNVKILTVKPDKSQIAEYNHYKEDYEIVGAIAKDNDLHLCNEVGFKKHNLSSNDFFAAFENIYDDVNQILGPNCVYDNTVVRIGGHLGETVRGYFDFDRMLQANGQMIKGKNRTILYDAVRKVIEAHYVSTEYSNVSDLTNYANSEYVMLETLDAKFFGKQIIRWMLSNSLMLTPFIDYSLRGIHVEKGNKRELIYAVIIKRCCPELLNYKFDSGHHFTEEAIEFADYLCAKYPMSKEKISVKPIQYSNFIHNEIMFPTDNEDKIEDVIEECVKQYWNDGLYALAFGRETAKIMYDQAIKKYEEKIIFHSEDRMVALYIAGKVLNIIGKANIEQREDIFDIPEDIVRFGKKHPKLDTLEKITAWNNDIFRERNLLQAVKKYNDKKIYLYGMGEWGSEFYDILSHGNIEIGGFIVTENPQCREYRGISVYTIDEISKMQDDIYIIPAVSCKYYDEIVNLLQQKGLKYLNVLQ